MPKGIVSLLEESLFTGKNSFLAIGFPYRNLSESPGQINTSVDLSLSHLAYSGRFGARVFNSHLVQWTKETAKP